ncbi:ATP-binding protein [Rubrivivax sp. RP6-9]|uniref:ATP-binding protein n=1 Tax=Rubrivivax sp. RP6-9 TaxID=3415750 RepID=UPI003CC5CE6A
MTAAALVVHDLKNELGALEGALQLLAVHPEPQAAAAAHRQCRLLRQRLVTYLAVYGADGPLHAVREDECPVALLHGVAARHADAPLPVRVQSGDGLPPFWVFDRRLVVMALEAALHNALRYARSAVVLGAHVHGSALVLTVDDDGPGPQPGPSGDSLATGLGTALCRAVAVAHGAAEDAVQLAARPQGGARFSLRLPT